MNAPDDILEAVTKGARHRMETRQVEMTVFKIGAELNDAHRYDEPEDFRHTIKSVTVYARGQNHVKSWPLPRGDRPWIGDRVWVTVQIPTEADDVLWHDNDLAAWTEAEAKRAAA